MEYFSGKQKHNVQKPTAMNLPRRDVGGGNMRCCIVCDGLFLPEKTKKKNKKQKKKASIIRLHFNQQF